MPEGYLHLTCEQRCQSYALLQSGHSQAHIARQIGVDPSTIAASCSQHRRARLSLQASARAAKTEQSVFPAFHIFVQPVANSTIR